MPNNGLFTKNLVTAGKCLSNHFLAVGVYFTISSQISLRLPRSVLSSGFLGRYLCFFTALYELRAQPVWVSLIWYSWEYMARSNVYEATPYEILSSPLLLPFAQIKMFSGTYIGPIWHWWVELLVCLRSAHVAVKGPWRCKIPCECILGTGVANFIVPETMGSFDTWLSSAHGGTQLSEASKSITLFSIPVSSAYHSHTKMVFA